MITYQYTVVLSVPVGLTDSEKEVVTSLLAQACTDALTELRYSADGEFSVSDPAYVRD